MLRTKFDPQESTFLKKFQVCYVVFPTELQTSTFVPEYLSNYIFQGAILDPYSSI